MPGTEKKKHRKGKVYPDADDEYGTDNHSFGIGGMEMDTISENENNITLKDKMKNAVKLASLTGNALYNISNAKAGVANKWKKYATTRRQLSTTSHDGGSLDRRKTGGMGLEYDLAVESVNHKATDKMDGKRGVHQQMIATHNRNLIEYFARLGQSKDSDESVNLDYLDSILNAGANINCTDKYGQTIFHEVARAWHVDIARYLVEKKADMNQADNYGRTPLHVAAAVDYPEMVNFLIKKGANKEALSKGEHQTPVHFAARNDACLSLKALLKNGCEYKDVRDYKGRTPLHIAAELDRSETARLLLELDEPAPAGVEDMSGQAAITWMIAKMPPVAKLALDQFHTTDRANRRQAYHLHRLEPKKPNEERQGHPQSPMSVVVRFRRFDLIEHPCFDKLIKDKWKKYGRLGAIINILVNITFILLWTLQGVLVEYDVRYRYDLPSQWWRILLFMLALLFTGWQLKEELSEYINSKRMHTKWRDWREAELKKDLEHAHPRWPEESRYLLNEREALDSQRPQYFNDFWNIFDWVCYGLLLVVIVTHLVDVGYHTTFIARLHIRIMAITIILIWIRLLKNARAFSYMGPFIVMLTHMMADVFRFIILYLEFFFPFACAFYMMFGGDKTLDEYQGLPDAANHTVTVNGMETFDALLFSLFRLTLVDEYDYPGMRSVDPIMAYILVGAWLGLSAILMLNLFIALLSDTFQRVYDNAQANAVMQKAITILGIEEGLSLKRREKFRKHIHEKCAPKEEDYDDDEVAPGGEDLQKVTIQIKSQLDEIQEHLEMYDTETLQDSDSDEQLDEIEHKLHNGEYAIGNKPRPRTFSMNSNLNASAGNKGGMAVDECVTNKVFTSETTSLRKEIEEIRSTQKNMAEKFKKDMRTVKDLLTQIASNQTNAIPPGETSIPDVPFYQDANRRASTLSRIEAPPIYSSYSALPQARPPQMRSSFSLRSRNVDQDWEMMDQQRTEELRQLRHDLAMRAVQTGTRPVTDDQNSMDDVLSGSQLVVEVSDQRIPHTEPPPYRSDSDVHPAHGYGARDSSNC